jgi:hypothetical protein
MPKIAIGVALLFLLLPSVAGAQSPILEEKKVAVFLYGTVHSHDTDGKPVSAYMPLGTGFLVSYPDPRGGPTYGFFYLATAKHVLRDVDGTFLRNLDVRVTLLNAPGDSKVDFIKNVPVSDEAGQLTWLHNENDNADETVALPFLPDIAKVDFKSIPVGMFVDDSELKADNVAEGDNVYFIGLLAQFAGTNHNYPVVRRGTIAMLADEPIKTETGPQKVFVAEMQSWPGNSGSPVFLNLAGLRNGGLGLGQNLRFFGILLGDFVNKVPAIVNGQEIAVGDANAANVGISLVVPAMALRAILDSPKAVALRDADIQTVLHQSPKSNQ